MPFNWECQVPRCGSVAPALDEALQHERQAHGAREANTVRVRFEPHREYARRTWSCARCAGQVAREDDGSMLCDDCQRNPLPPHGGRNLEAPHGDGRWLP